MRSHAKAASTDSTTRPHRRHLLPLLAAIVAALALALGAASASAVAPVIAGTTVSAVTAETAVLEAEINPGEEATTYHFEYGPAECSANPCTRVPAGEGNVGSGSEPVHVSDEVTGLAPGTTYYFRVVAVNGSGPVAGADRTFATYPSPEPAACPNEAFRTGFGAGLPDCRAYEMVTPVDKNNGDIRNGIRTFGSSSTSGEKITYSSFTAFGDAESNPLFTQYLTTRGADGWTTEGISPRQSNLRIVGFLIPLYPFFKVFTPDLSKAVFLNLSAPLTPDGISPWADLYLRDNTTDSWQALITSPPTHYDPPEDNEFWPEPQNITPDGSHVLFKIDENLTPDSPYNGVNGSSYKEDNLFDWHDGELELVSILPNEEPSTLLNSAGTFNSVVRTGGEDSTENAISEDGSRIYWSAGGEAFNTGRVYVRVDGEETLPVTGSVSNAEGRFWTASSDGSKALFTIGEEGEKGTDSKLQSGGEGEPLYEFHLASESSTLIAPHTTGVLGASQDLSYIYFASPEVLDAGATAGESNLYSYHDGQATFIATVTPGEGSVPPSTGLSNVAPLREQKTSAVNPSGSAVVFSSTRSLTGYDNTPAGGGSPAWEVYRYDSQSETLTCVSCNPSGARPLTGTPKEEEQVVAGRIPRWVAPLQFKPRVISDDGSKVFFESFDALVPRDTNGQRDVYEWEEGGSGSCARSAGCVSLISSGKSSAESQLVDSGASGRDVFISTSSSFAPQDPGLVDIYDARTDGGFPAPPAPADPCVGDSCQSPAATPPSATPASAQFHGEGDLHARRSCREPRVAKLLRKARSLSRRAAHTDNGAKTKHLRKQAHSLRSKAKALGRREKRCTRRARRAGR